MGVVLTEKGTEKRTEHPVHPSGLPKLHPAIHTIQFGTMPIMARPNALEKAIGQPQMPEAAMLQLPQAERFSLATPSSKNQKFSLVQLVNYKQDSHLSVARACLFGLVWFFEHFWDVVLEKLSRTDRRNLMSTSLTIFNIVSRRVGIVVGENPSHASGRIAVGREAIMYKEDGH